MQKFLLILFLSLTTVAAAAAIFIISFISLDFLVIFPTRGFFFVANAFLLAKWMALKWFFRFFAGKIFHYLFLTIMEEFNHFFFVRSSHHPLTSWEWFHALARWRLHPARSGIFIVIVSTVLFSFPSTFSPALLSSRALKRYSVASSFSCSFLGWFCLFAFLFVTFFRLFLGNHRAHRIVHLWHESGCFFFRSFSWTGNHAI